MSEERKVETPSGTAKALTPEMIADRKAKILKVLDRGYLNDRLMVSIPNDLHGEWVDRRDDVEIMRKKGLGFDFYIPPATAGEEIKTLQSDGTKHVIVGDVVLMTIAKPEYEIIQSVYRERFKKTHMQKKPQEQQQFETQMKSTAPELGIIDESSTTRIVKEGTTK